MSNLKAVRRRITVDYTFENHLSLWLVRANNIGALEHLQENVQEDAQWFGEALAVEPRYVDGLAEGLRENGWSVA